MPPPSPRRPRPSLLDSLGETAGHRNALLLIQLRWLAVFGQSFTIVAGTLLFGLRLPLAAMFGVIGVLVLLNLASMLRPRGAGEVRNGELFGGLLVDFGALTGLLYLSGGASNPFVFLYLLQVALGASLLGGRSAWALVGLACVCFALLTRFHLPLRFADGDPDPQRLFALHLDGLLVCFVLDAVLLVGFVRRIGANLRRRDERLADLRQHAAEEDHIVRMGLLASGAAHELGTPLATLSVLVGDWRHAPEFRDHPERREELAEMAAQLARIKGIVGGVLRSAGEARGEAPVLTTVARALEDWAAEWRALAPDLPLDVRTEEPLDGEAFYRAPIVADAALRQVLFNVLDNAREASPRGVALSVRCRDGDLRLAVRDRGSGFPPGMLARLGKPYQSGKSTPGSGLGLFLVVNILRKLGGSVHARNLDADDGSAGEVGGAEVVLTLPLAALAFDGEGGHVDADDGRATEAANT